VMRTATTCFWGSFCGVDSMSNWSAPCNIQSHTQLPAESCGRLLQVHKNMALPNWRHFAASMPAWTVPHGTSVCTRSTCQHTCTVHC
jgi:hypothetical protein